MNKHHYRAFLICLIFFSLVSAGLNSNKAQAAGRINYFKANGVSPSITVNAGTIVTISWSASAPSCTSPDIDTGDGGPTTGSYVFNAYSTYTYTLNCGTAVATVTVNVNQPTTVSISASPNPLISGNTANLTWSSTYATSCTGTNGWNTGNAPSGSIAVNPTTSTTYNITCYGSGAPGSNSVTLTVNPAPLGASCNVNPSTAAISQNVNWYASAWGGIGPYNFSWIGESLSTLSGASVNTSYTSAGTKNASVSVTDSSASPGGYSDSVQDNIVCTGSPLTSVTGDVQDGGYRSDAIRSAQEEATYLLEQYPGNCVMADVHDTYSCDAGPGEDGGGGPHDAGYCPWTIRNQVFSGTGTAAGKYTFPNGSVYSGSAIGVSTGGTHSQTIVQACTNAVTVAPNAPTATLTANPVSIVAGNSSTLTWSSTNASSCTGSGFSTGNAVSGSVGVSPGTTTGYSVTCTGAGGNATANATVNVTPAPLPNLTADQPPNLAGLVGQPLGLQVTARNNGGAGTGRSFPSTMWVTQNTSTFGTDIRDTQLGVPNGYPANYSEPVPYYAAQSWTPPAAGTYYYALCVDLDSSFHGVITESNEGDNCSGWGTITVGALQANLYNSVGAGSNITAGDTATLTATTGNNGNGTANPFYDLFLIYDSSYNFTYANDTTYYAYVTSPTGPWANPLNPGQTVGESASYTFNHPGIYYYRMYDDWGQNIAETNENDNWSGNGYAQIRVRPKAPTGLTYSCNASGTQVTLSWNPTDGAKNYYVRLGAPANINSDAYPYTTVTYGVTPGQSYTWWVHANASATADYDSTQFSDPTYGPTINCAGLPDLTATTASVGTATVGIPFTLSGTISNIGISPAAGGFDNYFIIYSTPASGNGNWAYTDGPYPYSYAGMGGTLAPAASENHSANYTFSKPGTYYYRLCADWSNYDPELVDGAGDNTPPSNNCGAYQQINVAPSAPTGLTYSCNAAGNQVTLSWNAAPGASSYYVRLYDGVSSNPYPGYAGYTDFYPGTSITYPLAPNTSDSAWVHSIAANGAYTPNPASIGFTCAGQPDVTAITGGAETAVQSQSHTYTGTVVNNGTASIPSSQALFQVCDWNGSTCVNYYQAGDGTEPALAAGASGPVSFPFTLPTARTDLLYRVCANLSTSGTAIQTESNYGNNCGGWSPITVTQPTLTCNASATSVNVGDTVTYSITPNGGATAPYNWQDSRPVYSGQTNGNSFAITYADAQNDGGSHQAQVTGSNTGPAYCPYVTVNGGYCTTATPLVGINAVPNRVAKGNSSTITWSASGINGNNATCSITGPGVSVLNVPVGPPPACAIPTIGNSAQPSINAQSKYVISCSNSSSSSTVVNLIPTFKEF